LELLERFGSIGPALVDLAVTHEMGYGIRQEKDERMTTVASCGAATHSIAARRRDTSQLWLRRIRSKRLHLDNGKVLAKGPATSRRFVSA
jgi:hypothetical protein